MKLKAFVSSNKFKQASLQYIASQMNQKELGGLIEIFNNLDTNGDGELSFEEFQTGVAEISKEKAEELLKVFGRLDADKNGSINYTEFIAATMTQNMYLKEEKIYQAFKLFDKNGDGFITADEIKQVLGGSKRNLNQDQTVLSEINQEVWESMIAEADINGDGVVDYNEFITLMSKL